MAEKGKMDLEHLGGVVRLREEHEKVIETVYTLLPVNQRLAQPSHAVFEPRVGLPNCFVH